MNIENCTLKQLIKEKDDYLKEKGLSKLERTIFMAFTLASVDYIGRRTLQLLP